jgi:hypothetical protein
MFIDDTETNPADGQPVAQAEPEEEVAAPEEEAAETSEEAPEEEGQAEDEEDEVEYQGKKARVPKWLKPAIMKDADYTQKTQSHAEQVRQWEEQRKSQETEFETNRQILAENMQGVTQIMMIDERLAKFAEVDWPAAYAKDSAKAGAAWAQYQQLKDARGELAGALDARHREQALKAQQDSAKRIEDGRKQLAQEIPGWNDQLESKNKEFATKVGNLSEKEFTNALAIPRVAKLINLARIGHELSEKARVAAKPKPNATQPEVEAKPVPQVGSRKSPPVTGPSDKDDVDTWLKKRNKQLRAAQ